MSLKDDYFTLSDFAEEVGVTRQTASRWLKDGKIIGEKIGREVLISKDELKKIDLEKYQDKLDAQIARTIIRHIVKAIREEYHYSEKDRIELISYDKDKDAINFSVVKKDGTREKVQTRIVKFPELGEEPEMKLEVTKIQDEK